LLRLAEFVCVTGERGIEVSVRPVPGLVVDPVLQEAVSA
jgi:hypothetical protein